MTTRETVAGTQVAVELGPVQETLLIPLLGRAQETRKANGLLKDERAVEVLAALDYDFSKWERSKSLIGSCLRTRMLDEYVEGFLEQNPAGTVVEIGCGLNTRYNRVDNGTVRWFDLDLPDVIALRRRFFSDSNRQTMLEGSVLDPDWMGAVRQTGGPWMFVSEAVLIYLPSALAEEAIKQIARTFPGCQLAFDTTSQKMVDGQARHDAMRHLPKASWFQWGCDDPTVIETWDVGLHLLQSKTFMDASDSLQSHLPRALRLMVRWFPGLVRSRIQGYRLNLALQDRPMDDNDQPSASSVP